MRWFAVLVDEECDLLNPINKTIAFTLSEPYGAKCL